MARPARFVEGRGLEQLAQDWPALSVPELVRKYGASTATLYATARRHGWPSKLSLKGKGWQTRTVNAVRMQRGANPTPKFVRCPVCFGVMRIREPHQHPKTEG